MDDIVRQAIAKWPNVPHCFGWLGLDVRGNWYLRDDQVQSLGSFERGGDSRGSVLRHDKLVAFIQRNYESDAAGQWFFQNGPQRVYVELEAAPLVWRVSPDGVVVAHTGQAARVQACVVDETGHLYLDTDIGFGIVHTQDVLHASDQVESGHWVPVSLDAASLPGRFGFVKSPQARRPAGGMATAESPPPG